MENVYVETLVLQGGSWVFDAADETWKKLMSGVSKWTMMSKTKDVSKPTYIFELCQHLAAKNEVFASQVFPKLSMLLLSSLKVIYSSLNTKSGPGPDFVNPAYIPV